MLLQEKHGRKFKLLPPPHYLIGLVLYHRIIESQNDKGWKGP